MLPFAANVDHNSTSADIRWRFHRQQFPFVSEEKQFFSKTLFETKAQQEITTASLLLKLLSNSHNRRSLHQINSPIIRQTLFLLRQTKEKGEKSHTKNRIQLETKLDIIHFHGVFFSCHSGNSHQQFTFLALNENMAKSFSTLLLRRDSSAEEKLRHISYLFYRSDCNYSGSGGKAESGMDCYGNSEGNSFSSLGKCFLDLFLVMNKGSEAIQMGLTRKPNRCRLLLKLIAIPLEIVWTGWLQQ